MIVGLLIYDILSRRRAHIPRTQPVLVCMRSGGLWQGAGIIWTIRAGYVFRELRQPLASVSPHYSRSSVASLLRWRIYSRGSNGRCPGSDRLWLVVLWSVWQSQGNLPP